MEAAAGVFPCPRGAPHLWEAVSMQLELHRGPGSPRSSLSNLTQPLL